MCPSGTQDITKTVIYLLVASAAPPLGSSPGTLGGVIISPSNYKTTKMREDGIFTALWRAVPNLQARDAIKNAWIMEATWKLVDERVSTRQHHAKDQSLIRRLVCAIAESLKGDMQRRADKAGAEAEALVGLDPPLNQEAWHRIKG